MTLLSRACASPYFYFIEIMFVRRTVYEIFSVKEWRDLETGGRGRSRSLKMAKWRHLTDHIRFFLLVGHCKYSCMLYHFQAI